MGPGQNVKVEAGDGHDWVIRPGLVSNGKVCKGIPNECEPIIITRLDRAEIGRGC